MTDDFVVEIEDSTPEPAEVVQEPRKVEQSDSPEVGIEDLKRQLAESNAATQRAQASADQMRAVAEEEGRRRVAAERAAASSAVTADTATAEAKDRQFDSIVSATHAVTNQLSSLRSQYVKAQTDGEFEKAADLNMQISKASAELVNLENGRAALEARKKESPAAPVVVQPDLAPQRQETQAQFNARPWTETETNNVLNNTAPTAAAWMRTHPEYFSNVSFRQQVQAAHNIMSARGVTLNSDEYIRGIERIVFPGDTPPPQTPHKDEAVSSAGKQVTTRTSPTPAAPPSRSVPASSTSQTNAAGQRVVRLTAAQVEFARMNFPKTKADDPEPEVIYARNLEALRREGKLKGDGASL